MIPKRQSLINNYSKDELAGKLLEALTALEEFTQLEKRVHTEEKALSSSSNMKNAAGMVKSEDGVYSMVKLGFDLETGAVAIMGTEELGKDQAIASHTLQKYGIDMIFRKARAGQYD